MYYSKLCNLRFFIIQLVDRYNSFGKSVKIKIKILIFSSILLRNIHTHTYIKTYIFKNDFNIYSCKSSRVKYINLSIKFL